MNVVHKYDVGSGVYTYSLMVKFVNFIPTIDASGQCVFLHLIAFLLLYRILRQYVLLKIHDLRSRQDCA
jgi:hypothetical protein